MIYKRKIKLIRMVFFFFISCNLLLLYSMIKINDYGVCISEGRILNDDELKERFIINLIRMNIKNFIEWEKVYPGHGSMIGIIPGYDDIDFIDVINKSFNNGMSFEKNFNIENISMENSYLDFVYPKFKLTLVHYGTRNDRESSYGNSTAYFESDIRKVDSFLIDEDRFSPTIFQRLNGYGNNFFSIKLTVVHIDCCDNKRYGQSEIDYMHMKSSAYNQSKKWIENNISYGNRITATVSNCGEILTRSTDNGMNTEEINRI